MRRNEPSTPAGPTRRSRPGRRATSYWKRGGCCTLPTAARMRAWKTFWSSAGATSCGAWPIPSASRWRSHAAVALATMGDRQGARRMAHDDLERARRWGAASGIGIALRAVALADDRADPVVLLREAIEVLERSPARLEHARALTDLGAALRRANHRTEARTVLDEALDLATNGNAPPSPSEPAPSCAPPAADRADRKAAGSAAR